MPLLNFKRRFVDPIRAGTKGHTIRAERKIPVKVGDKLYLYCGLRQKGAFRILPEAVKCTKTEVILIRGGILSSLKIRPFQICVDGIPLAHDEAEQLARADGFSELGEMVEFWKGRTPFTGQIIHWR